MAPQYSGLLIYLMSERSLVQSPEETQIPLGHPVQKICQIKYAELQSMATPGE